MNMTKKHSITTYMKTMTGLTLIELMVTLSVIAILAAVGLPRLQGMSSGNRMSATINALAADLALARSEAVNRNRTITITQAAGGWSNGWTVDAIAVVGLPAIQLSSRGAVPNGMTLVEDTGIIDITYTSDGLNPGLARNFTLCEPGKIRRQININRSGRYTTRKGAACP